MSNTIMAFIINCVGGVGVYRKIRMKWKGKENGT